MKSVERYIELPPVKERTSNYDRMERAIKRTFRERLYKPLLKILDAPAGVLSNANETALQKAIALGRVVFDKGRFSGEFNAAVSKELRLLGAKWDKASSSYQIHLSQLTPELQQQIATSAASFAKRLARIDAELQKILPEEIAGSVDTKKFFDSTLWDVDRSVRQSLKRAVAVPAKLEKRQADRISAEWQNNMELWIKTFTEDEIKRLRGEIQEHVLKGGRHADIVSMIEGSYGVTKRKARFLARQETALLMTKFKETRYTEAGISEYKWGCVAGSKNHPVRPSHKILEGKIFRWDSPPITTAPSEPPRRNNPGQDFNCRCFAKPVIKIKEK
jgi:SPP1 gp7 family putative phage head morphogenesis protein